MHLLRHDKTVTAQAHPGYTRPQPMPSQCNPREAERWVNDYGDMLYRHALVRVREHATAQDLVQDTFLAAWHARQKRPAADSEAAWLLGILRRKTADYFRHRARQETPWDPSTLASIEASHFRSGGWCGRHWQKETGPRGWWATSASLRQREFFQVLERCTEKLPDQAARVFLLRELDEHTTQEICALLDLSSSHLFVLLHRARLALRHCLELNWFGRKKRPKRGN